MNFFRVLNSFSRLSVLGTNNIRSISTNTSPLCFQATNCLFAEPLKKKKRLDPAIIRMREERKRRRIEKRIRRLEKLAKQLKPIGEVEVPLKLIDEQEKRARKLPPLTSTEIEEIEFLQKDWTRFLTKEIRKERFILHSVRLSQQRALDELKAESLELYMNAISIDPLLLPFESNGPTYTPPIKGYIYRDGEYIDITKKFDGE